MRQKIPAFLANQPGQAAIWFVEKHLDALEVDNALRDCVTVFVEHCPQRIHKFGALTDETFTGPEQHRPGLLPLRPGFHKAHLRPLRRDHDRLGVGRMIFCRFTNGRTYWGAISFTAWPSSTSSRAQ